jgi:hypothetical protein
LSRIYRKKAALALEEKIMTNKIGAKHRLLLSRKSERDKLTKRRRIKDLNSQAHEIANQLSVINLCCFKLRDSLAGELNGDQLRRLDTIAMAVTEAADVLDKFSESLKTISSFAGSEKADSTLLLPLSASTGNVYHISPQLKP